MMMDEARFIREFAEIVHARPRAAVDIANQLAMMEVTNQDDMTAREWQLYREGVRAALTPLIRQRVAAVLRRDFGKNKIVSTLPGGASSDDFIRGMLAFLTA